MEHSVVFPEPDGPTRATISPDSIVSVGVVERDDLRRRRPRTPCGRRASSKGGGHEQVPIAEAGSTRRTRRREKAQPTTAATSSRTALVTIRRS